MLTSEAEGDVSRPFVFYTTLLFQCFHLRSSFAELVAIPHTSNAASFLLGPRVWPLKNMQYSVLSLLFKYKHLSSLVL